MSGHGRSVFLNSCIKKPLNPTNRHPNPSYLVPQCSLDRGPNDPQLQDNMNAITRKKANNKCPLARTGHQRKTKCCSITQQLRKESDNFQSLAEFYASIPDYNDLNHLPNKEFYCKLNTLRRKQKELKFACLDGFELCKRTAKSPAGLAESSTNDYNEDNDSLHSWSKSPPTVEGILSTARKSASKSVRIESTKNHDDSDSDGRNSRRKFRAGTPFVSDYEDSTKNISSSTTPINSNFVERYDRYIKRNIRSKSASPIRNYSNITIPQPYKMTQREEDERALQELLIASKNAFSSKESVNKLPSTHIKANPVPITSRIPLFDTIMADQEYRNRLAKLNSEIVLQQQMKPFHFSERLNRPNSRCLSRSLSSPALLTTGFETDPAVAAKFKAKPCPKNLFSNYFYFKMWEDEYFRNMNKRLRAEELMKQASLPPSMARRERALQSEAPLNNRKSKRKRKPKRNTKRKKSTEDRGTGYFAKVGASDSHGRESAKLLYPSSNSSCSISTDTAHLPGLDATPIYPVNRPNLAATLRTEWCRKKLRELDLEEDSLQKKTPKFEWGVKKSQAFQNLTFDTTHQEELNLRLATRRAEQKLRQEEHAINMELMRQRVKAAPLLLEGPPQWGPRLGHVAHRCLTSGSRSSDPLFHKSTKNRSIKKIPSDGRRRNSTNDSRIGNEHHQSRSSEKQRFSSSSKLSNYSLDSFGQNSSKFCDSDILCKVDDELDSFTGEV
ncbi:protein FAM161A [Sabethes cyaneus]|uniref:protein FAM161A n=1 Tax=Sabethes cyaneus TaxID=53552 RepID=UPI00237EB191|nr:protein FAM161A [Sabethes cyaneus]